MEKRRKNRIILSHRYSDTRFRRKKTGSSHATRDWSLPDTVYLNPEKVHEQSEKADEQMAVS